MAGFITDPDLIAQLEAASAAQPRKIVTDPDLIKKLDSHAGQPPPPAPPAGGEEGWGDYAKGVGRSVAKGVTFNWGDELEASLRGLAGQDREMALAKIRDEMQAFSERHPYVSTGAEIAGAVAVPGAAALKGGSMVAKALTPVGSQGFRRGATGLAARVGTGAAVGAGQGAVGGVGELEDKTNWGGAATDGAILGGAIGGAIPVALQGAKTAWRTAASLPKESGRLGPLTRGTKEKAATEAIDEAIVADAKVGGRTREAQIKEIRDAIVVDQQSARGTGTASILSAADDKVAGRSGENLSALAKNEGERSHDAQAYLRKAARASDDALPGKEYDQFYTRGTVNPKSAEARTLTNMVQQDPEMKSAYIQALRELKVGSRPTPKNGEFSAQLLHIMDRKLRASAERAAGNKRDKSAADAIGKARTQFKSVIDSVFPDTPNAPSLSTLETRTAAGKSQIKAAEAAFTKAGSDNGAADRILDDALQAGTAGMLNRPYHAAHALRRGAMRLARGDLDKGVTIARLVSQQAGRKGSDAAAEMKRILDAIEKMPERRRNKYVDAMIAASNQQASQNTDENPLMVHVFK